MSINNYNVSVSEYAEKHFIKDFSKKYKTTWQSTMDSIFFMLSHIDNFLLTNKAKKIHSCDTWMIIKCEFKISWSNESPKTSGNRIIVFKDNERNSVEILLIYCKNNYNWNNETVWWEQQIKNNHKEIYELFNY